MKRESKHLPDPTAEFLAAAASISVEFEPGDIEKLSRYLALLLEANTRFNLTAVTDPAQAWMRHILDSLTLVPHIVSSEAKAVIDVGSGGGLPGIPLAVVLPKVRFTLLEATGKKAAFLRDAARELELSNATVVQDRAETIGQQPSHRERYDVVIARAVGRLPVLLELTVPLAKVGGNIIAMKGAQAAAEILDAKPALHLLHATITSAEKTITGTTLVIIEKLRKTPHAYPRGPGEPKRVPLGVR